MNIKITPTEETFGVTADKLTGGQQLATESVHLQDCDTRTSLINQARSQYTRGISNDLLDILDGVSPSTSTAMSITKEYEPNRPLQPISLAKFALVGVEMLERINPDGSSVTKDQLAKAMQDPSFKGEQAQAVAAMYKEFDKLHNLNDHHGFYNSISAGDLIRFAQVQKEHEDKVSEAYDLKFWVAENLQKFTKDKNGVAYSSDIAKALEDPNLSTNNRKNLTNLQKVMPAAWFWEDGLKASDVARLATEISSNTDEAKLVNGVSWDIQRTADAQRTLGDTELYSTANPLDSIKPDAIKQGMIGDCYFEASLAAVANSNPSLIRDAIQDNHDGTYTVNFPGAKAESITVKAPTEQEMGLYNSSSQDGIWASVMEKAYGKYRDNHNWIGTYMPQEAADGGGHPADTMKLLTGQEVATTDMRDKTASTEPVIEQLEKAFSTNSPRAVTASSMVYWNGFWAGWDSHGNTADGIAKGHAFTVIGFHPDGTGSGTVTMRNPWGMQGDRYSGDFEVPFSTFVTNFQTLDVTR
jgi:hypothetical protein